MPMSVETYRELALDRQPELEMNGRGAEDFRVSLNHPGDTPYHPCLEAFPDEAVPPGEVSAHRAWSGSRIFSGTRRDVFVHVPSGLDRAAGANLIVFNDGVGYLSRKGAVRAGQVIDALVARGEIPPIVGIFVNPGSLRDDGEPDWDQRRREYDPLTSDYGRFLIEELLPFVEEKEGLRFTDDPAGRIVCGISSGGIAAFTAAWRFPEQFAGVISHCGSFVNIDGGHNYPFLVRSTPRKPIRVFIQSGENDGRNVYGHWPMANQVMADALAFAGYDVRFEFGTGGHTLRHGGALFAETLRWMLRPRG
ncbi:MAG TPA: alpha/beta hydrolase-fold protein [Caulobacteraceae bacterium]|jgi:enterochelin esterase-like enzyme|nr:alpha/beta hydrolase-fold protein [Caulobacteraceae bacterium]